VLGVVLIVGLTQVGCNSDTKIADAHGHDHSETESTDDAKESTPPMRVNDATLEEDADLNQVVADAVANIKKGRESGDMSLVMNEGIMKLKAVTQRDSNNVAAIYQLGLMSIESGQTEKAIKRFEKLLLLQPENQEYKKILADLKG